MQEQPKKFTILNLDLSAVHAEPVSHQLEVVDVPHRKRSPRFFFPLKNSRVHQAVAPGSVGDVMRMTSVELDQLTNARSLAHMATKSARRRGSVSHDRTSTDDHSPRYGKIEQQFLPKETATRGVVPQRAHKIVVRNGRLVDVTEEEEDKMAITAVKKAEEHARERAVLGGAGSPLKSPRLAEAQLERVLLPRSPRGSAGYAPSPRSRSSQNGPSPEHPFVGAAVSAVPVAVSFREIRAAAVEVFSVHVEPVEIVEVEAHTVETVSIMEPVAFHVEPVRVTSMVVETVEVQTTHAPVAMASPASPPHGAAPLSRVSGSIETVDGASHPILSLDFTDREMSDTDLVPELAKLPDDRTLVLLLSGNDMLREGAEELNRLFLEGKRVQSLQLQWNLLGSEGAAALVPGLSATKFLKFVDLTGNELEEEGAIALAAGLKENRSIQSLVIPENQIGNEGITVIAHALKQNTTLQTLDVSNNNIFEEGASFLGSVLEQHNRTLVELRLTGNSLRNDGAAALARAVAVHPKLEHLECRNCVIDDQGIIDLCQAVVGNPANVFEYMDLSLNNFSIRSELFMQDLLMSVTCKADVHWKELDASRLFEIEEIDQIVDHFGVATIIDKYLKEETLLPLIPFDVLLPNISFNDPELSDGLVSNVLDKLHTSRTLFIRGMDLLNILLYHLTSSDAIITTITENHVIDSIFARLGSFVEILTSAKYNNVHGTARSRPRLGFVRFKTLELLVNLMKFNNPHLHEQLVEHRVISHLLDLMFEWPDNNFVHHQIKDLIVIILYSQSEILLTDLLITARLPQRIMEVYQPQTALDVGFHKGFFGHLTEMANYVSTSLPTFHYMATYTDWAVWDRFVAGPLEATNQILESSYDGCDPTET